MKDLFARFERFIVVALLMMMSVVVLLGTVRLGVILVEKIASPPGFMLIYLSEMLEIFSFFLLLLVGLELIEVIKDYLIEDTIHAEVVLLVAIIAIARKVVVLDLKAHEPPTLLGIAALIISLGICFFLAKRALRTSPRSSNGDGEDHRQS
jgi:uncharacterized membrane protein (DUF373 family)